MHNIVLVILPVLAVVALGYVLARIGYISSSVIDGLSRYVFAIGLPALIFRNMANGGLPSDLTLVWELLASYFVAATIIFLLGLAVGHFLFRAGKAEQNIIAVGASHSNLVLLGVPAVLMILGTKYVTPLIIVVGIHGVLMSVILTVVVHLSSGKAAGAPAAALTAAVGQAKNPVFIALVLGILYDVVGNMAGFPRLPDMVNSILRTLSSALYPCALFALGGTVLRHKFGARVNEAIAVTALKLAAFPFVVWLIARPLLGMPSSWTWVAVMLALMPVGFNMHNLANRSDKATALANTAIAMSTILSFVAIAVMLYVK